jgi:hypothetical protein
MLRAKFPFDISQITLDPNWWLKESTSGYSKAKLSGSEGIMMDDVKLRDVKIVAAQRKTSLKEVISTGLLKIKTKTQGSIYLHFASHRVQEHMI